ncbi:hypothetical protein PoB_001311600 [Plakobranchus ocellatus]|uniref:Uncharacterized protein n=1 Tax=Plakobranchus ocellatus TaxID=259542 RepID=A0AAV3YT79_9GAST|nr:hypothetical protein PoB_001311600 [Plakobranchus ocellatus]
MYCSQTKTVHRITPNEVGFPLQNLHLEHPPQRNPHPGHPSQKGATEDRAISRPSTTEDSNPRHLSRKELNSGFPKTDDLAALF